MQKVLVYSLLLVAGLVGSQFLPQLGPSAYPAVALAVKLLTMTALAYIMIHVGYEFEIDKSNPRQYAWDYFVAFTAASFPWIFCALYFVFVMAPAPMWGSYQLWVESLLESRFAAPTSAGVLFSMLAAAGLAATWVFKKARVLAIFDDLDTILLMIPLKMLMVGLKWQLAAIVLVIVFLLCLAWRYLHVLRIPISWPWVLTYSAVMVAVCEAIYIGSKVIDDVTPIHLEVLLPAFVLGCMMARPAGADPHADDAREGHEEGPESPVEQRVSTLVSASFMVLVGLSMPLIAAPTVPADVDLARDTAVTVAHMSDEVAAGYAERYPGIDPAVVAEKKAFPGWGMIAFHVIVVTLLANLGKMFPALCYRREAHWRERLAVAIGMFPRGEVGAGVLVVSISYGISGPALTVATLSLALNLLLTGVFILIVRRLIAAAPPRDAQPAVA